MVTWRTLNQFEIRAELFSAVSSEGKCFFKAITNKIRQEPVKREAEILKEQGLITISLKHPFLTQQDAFALLVKIAEVHNNCHIRTFHFNLLIKKQRFIIEPFNFKFRFCKSVRHIRSSSELPIRGKFHW